MIATATKERAITLKDFEVRAILDGRKTQKRFVVKPQHPDAVVETMNGHLLLRSPIRHQYGPSTIAWCPQGEVGDRLWVRETFSPSVSGENPNWLADAILYAADNPGLHPISGCSVGKRLRPRVPFVGPVNFGWTPSTRMPRWASRITLEITGVRLERLNEISEEDAWAEGFPHPRGKNREHDDRARYWFKTLWNQINGGKIGAGWELNPWVWALSFRRIVHAEATP